MAKRKLSRLTIVLQRQVENVGLYKSHLPEQYQPVFGDETYIDR